MNRTLEALRILWDILWIGAMIGLSLALIGFFAAILARVVAFGYNLLPI